MNMVRNKTKHHEDDDQPDEECPDNYVVPGPELANGDRICIAHHDGHQSDVAVMRKIRCGESLPDDAQIITPIEGTNLYQINESIADLKAKSNGPAKVNSRSYRSGYDRIFGKKSTVGQA